MKPRDEMFIRLFEAMAPTAENAADFLRVEALASEMTERRLPKRSRDAAGRFASPAAREAFEVEVQRAESQWAQEFSALFLRSFDGDRR
jgi:hypothetical protein